MRDDMMSVRDIEALLDGFKFLSIPMKRTLLFVANHETMNLSEIRKEEVLRNMYNVYSIVGKFNCEELFKNGRITFRDDNELIFDTIVGPHITYTEIMLFQGCTIAKGDGSSYIMLNNIETPDLVLKVCNSFDFDKLIRDAITPPEISIIINIGYYPSLIENVLQVMK